MSSDGVVATGQADRDGNAGPTREAAAVVPPQKESVHAAFQSFSRGFSSLKALNVLHRDGGKGAGAAKASSGSREEALSSKDGAKQRHALESDTKEKENKSAGAGGGGGGGGVSSTLNLFSQGLAGIKSSPLMSMRGSSLLPGRAGLPKWSSARVPVVEMSAEDSAAVAAAGLGSSPPHPAATTAFSNNHNNSSSDPPTSRSSIPSLQDSPLGLFTKGLSTMKNSAIKSVTTRARHLVSQNKRRYQEDGFDLDMTYITENVIAMGFPAGDISSGLFGYMEGFYRNHMEEVIRFFDTHHKGCYKVYNLCSERLYDAGRFEGKVACFPFDDHNCPPLQMLTAFCESAYAWLREGMDNVVVVHCKAGMARTGLMICCLLLYLKFFPTAEEAIAFFNSKRCVDGLALVIPSQQRYVKYFERILREVNGETPKPQKRILRGIRLHRCPYWIRPAIAVYDHNGLVFSTRKHPRTRDLMPDDVWHNAPRKGVVVFALPGERCVAELCGDFKVCFHDRHGDFHCWLNTSMMDSRQMLTARDMDNFDKRRLPSPGLVVEIVVLDPDAVTTTAPSATGASCAAAAPGTHGGGPAADSSSVRRTASPSPVTGSSTGGSSVRGNEQAAGGISRQPPGAAGASVGSIGGTVDVNAMGGGMRSKQDDIFSDSESEEGDASRRAAGVKLGGGGGCLIVGDGGKATPRQSGSGGGGGGGGGFGNGKGRQGGDGVEISAPILPPTSIAAAAMANIVGGVKNAMDSLRLGIGSGGTISVGGGSVGSGGISRAGAGGGGGGEVTVSATSVAGGKAGGDLVHLQGRLAGDAAAALPSSGAAVLGSSPSRATDAISSPSSQRLTAPALEIAGSTASAGEVAHSPFPSSPTPRPETTEVRAAPVPLSAKGASDGGGSSLLSAMEVSSFGATAAGAVVPSAGAVTGRVGLTDPWSDPASSDGRTAEEVLNSFAPSSDFQAIAAASAADASVFTFGEDDDLESDEEE